MEYKFLDSVIKAEELNLPESDKINKFLLKNNSAEVIKALDFLASGEKFLYLHGFLGTGKRQFINYITEFLGKEVIKLEYYCKQSTVCDDILLSFIDIIEKSSLSKAIQHSAKITTLAVKLQQYFSSIKKPFIIIIHSYDNVQQENLWLISELLNEALKCDNVKLIISSRAMIQDILDGAKTDRKIQLKALKKDLFNKFVKQHKISGTESSYEEFYKQTGGYYYYTALTIKIIQAMNISLNDFMVKFAHSGMNYDEYLGFTYINLIPNAIRNFFWFLRFLRHGITTNALAVFELYDDFSIEYLKNNLMIYQSDDVIYVHDYFQQDIDISIPQKTEIKLHKYIINIYEKELKLSLQDRDMLLSRQAMRAEIEFHNDCIKKFEDKKLVKDSDENADLQKDENNHSQQNASAEDQTDVNVRIRNALKLAESKKYTDALESFNKITEECNVDSNTLAEIRLAVAKIYKEIEDYPKSQHFFELVETYYKRNDEFINLNYLYYELTKLYFLMYKTERAIETIKKVIYSVDTPQSLMVDACILLGNIYGEDKNPEEAYKYYQKALESVDDNTPDETKAELYFKYALSCDENEDFSSAFEYYTKCITVRGNNPYKALAYSNMGACYYDNDNDSDAKYCFRQAYDIEKNTNNYDGIYYTASYLAKIYSQTDANKAYEYMKEAKQSAEFINDDFCIMDATITLGDYYYNDKDSKDKALIEYLKAKKIAKNYADSFDVSKIDERIQDMKLRIPQEEFEKIEAKYG